MNVKEAQEFAARFATGAYAPEEHAAFLQWLKEASEAELASVMDAHEANYEKWIYPPAASAEWVMQIEEKLDRVAGMPEMPTVMDDRRRPVRWNFWMTAAAAVVVVSAGAYLYVQQAASKPHNAADQGKMLSMIVANPRGEAQKVIVLEDGSKVWLNAGSVFKYPPHFAGDERTVELSGEAFFDVTGNPRSPFRVLIRDAEVDVLGTYFVIMAYDDEPASRTTLVNGALKIVSGQQQMELKPGDQVEVSYALPGVGPAMTQHPEPGPSAEINVVRAWQHGIYMFKQKELHAVIRELERVFDVTVQYQPGVGNPLIDGNLDLNKGLDIVLKQLESCISGDKINFKHEGKTILASSV